MPEIEFFEDEPTDVIDIVDDGEEEDDDDDLDEVDDEDDDEVAEICWCGHWMSDHDYDGTCLFESCMCDDPGPPGD
jgi:hypothetical protein